MSNVRCKFKVDSIERTIQSVAKKNPDGSYVLSENGKSHVYAPGEMWTVKMSPVYANNDPAHENSKFWAASPGGAFALNTVNKEAVDSLELGGEYYIDIHPAATKG